MKVTEHIHAAQGKTLFSFEILPPLKGHNINELFDEIHPLMDFNPSFINVTYHREEFTFKEVGDGLLQKKIVRKRPGTVGICAAIQARYGVDAIPHVLCGSFSREDTENLLIDLDFLGIDNVMALRGDALKSEVYFTPEKDGNAYASELVTQIHHLNKGIYLDEEQQDSSPTSFCIGVSGYPEKHLEAPSFESDLQYLKHKVDCGADFLVTQLFFDNTSYFDFVRRCREAGILIPIIPGLKPLTHLNQLRMLPQRFNIDLPHELVKEAKKAPHAKAVKELGIEWCIAQSQELKEAGVPVLHYYSMGKSASIEAVVRTVF
jgi:methylenetetrahydrofolate reductase (NADPH)